MSIRGMMGFGGLAVAYDNMVVSAGAFTWQTSPVPNAKTSQSIKGNVSTFTAPWEGAASSEFWLHAHMYPGTNDSNNDSFEFGWANGSTALGWITFQDTTNRVRIFVNGSGVATAAGDALTTAAWATVHVHVTLNGTTGEIHVYLDGNLDTPVVSFTGNTDPTAAGTADAFHCRLFRVGDHIANFVAMDPTDATGIVLPAQLKNIGITNLAPTGDGNYSAWTPDSGGTGYTQVDEAPPSDADYVEATAVAQRSTFTFDTIGTVPSVLAARWASRITRSGTDAGSNLQVSRRYASTDYDEATVAAPTDGYVFETWDQKPGGGNWTGIDLDATEFGLESVT